MAGQEEINEIPVYKVKCPKCKARREYSPKKVDTKMDKAYFTCKKCHIKSRVLPNGKKVIKKTKKSSKKNQKSSEVISKASGINASDTIDRPLPVKDPGFEKFARWLSIPAYKGLHKWQKEHHDLTWNSEYEMTLVPRDHGKSVEYTMKYEWAMEYKDFDVLLLGWTDRRKEVSMYVYSFFAIYDLIEKDKRTSPFHFRLKNGGKFDCYLITSKETLGMHSEGEQSRFNDITEAEWTEFCGMFHNIDVEAESERVFSDDELRAYVESRRGSVRKLWISIDDPIDISFMKERHKEASLELHFQSSLYPIHPNKWSFTGTCKFEDDFFHFIRMTFGNQLVEYKRGTRNPDGTLLCPERFTAPDQATYLQDKSQYVINAADMTLILNPKTQEPIPKIPKRDLAEVRRHVGEYAWWSEYEQNPHPVTGEVWEGIEHELLLDTPVNRKYDLMVITIDRATTLRMTSDYTGCLFLVREIKRGIRIIIEDLSGNVSFDDLLYAINEFVIEWRKKYESMMMVMVVEKQGGGDDFITMAKNTKVFIGPEGQVVRNMIPELLAIEPIHNTGEKLERIKQRLFAPIKNGKCRLLNVKRGCEVEKEILSFPYPAKLDAIDALANAEFMILEKYHWVEGADGSHINTLLELLKLKESRKAIEYGEIDKIEKYEESRGLRRTKKRGIFD